MNTDHEANSSFRRHRPCHAAHRRGQSGEPGRTDPSWTAGTPGLLRDNYNPELVAENTGLSPILDNLANTRPDDTARLAELAAAARAAFERRTPRSPPGASQMGRNRSAEARRRSASDLSRKLAERSLTSRPRGTSSAQSIGSSPGYAPKVV